MQTNNQIKSSAPKIYSNIIKQNISWQSYVILRSSLQIFRWFTIFVFAFPVNTSFAVSGSDGARLLEHVDTRLIAMHVYRKVARVVLEKRYPERWSLDRCTINFIRGSKFRELKTDWMVLSILHASA